MAGRGEFVERLRTQGGPSHELLVLLDTHRVLTTDQVARATGAPVRTVRYRLGRLREYGLVDEHRPGREVGSAPSHWWLRPAGARLVTGASPPSSGRPSHPFVAHAAAIGQVWLAVRDRGPDAGIALSGWAADRAGWQEWDPPSGYGYGTARRRRLTPDAVLCADVTAGGVSGAVTAMVEVDLATMTQTQLREKLGRYVAYARDRAWTDTFGHCPPMLLLTTTPARATGYIRAARKTLAAEAPPRPYGHDRAEADLAAAGHLVVAACGLVRDPDRAVVEACWLLAEEATGEVTLAEVLAERVAATARTATAQAAVTARRRELDRLDVLDEVRRHRLDTLAGHLAGDLAAAEALLALAVDPDGFLTDDPRLAAAVVGWWGPRARRRRPTGPPPAGLVDQLRARHRAMWAGHARAVLAAEAHIDADSPRLASLAARLQDGRLLAAHQLTELDTGPGRDRRGRQADALADYLTRRDADVAAEHAALPWLTRHRTTIADLTDAHDTRCLLVCDVCAMVAARPDPDQPEAWDPHGDVEGAECRHCWAGHLTAPTRPVPALADRLADLRARLRHQ